MNPDSKIIPSWSVSHLKSPVDGVEIRYAVREIEQPAHRILFLNGRSEWIEKYQDLPGDTRFGEDSFWVMMDHRGQGGSDGLKAHVTTYETFAKDVAAVVNATFEGQPYSILAHSMGGLISLYGTLTGVLTPQSLALCSPLMGMLMPMPKFAAKALALVFTYSPFSTRSAGGIERRKHFKDNPLTQSKRRFRSMTECVYQSSPPTFAWVHATFGAFRVLNNAKYLSGMKIPVAIIVGEKEAVVDRTVYESWLRKWAKLSGRKGVFMLVAGAQHELLNEADKYRNQAIEFINKNLRV
ncbi:MAG: alpha/beta hydrolase [Oligoflexus sp.]|nr:alpha/beta hydrolase [Oligoflexus sp.]